MDIPTHKILIIIPAYNEEKTVGQVISDIKKEMPGADIVVVDDGSRDSTAAAAQGLGVKALTHPFNMGVRCAG